MTLQVHPWKKCLFRLAQPMNPVQNPLDPNCPSPLRLMIFIFYIILILIPWIINKCSPIQALVGHRGICSLLLSFFRSVLRFPKAPLTEPHLLHTLMLLENTYSRYSYHIPSCPLHDHYDCCSSSILMVVLGSMFAYDLDSLRLVEAQW